MELETSLKAAVLIAAAGSHGFSETKHLEILLVLPTHLHDHWSFHVPSSKRCLHFLSSHTEFEVSSGCLIFRLFEECQPVPCGWTEPPRADTRVTHHPAHACTLPAEDRLFLTAWEREDTCVAVAASHPSHLGCGWEGPFLSA